MTFYGIPLGPVTTALRDLLPPACLACGRLRPQPRASPSLGLCLPCRGRLAPFPRQLCPGCLRERSPAPRRPGRLCPPCRELWPFRDLLALWIYRPPLTEVLRRYKFGRLDYLGSELARLLASELVSCTDVAGMTVTAVPLHWWRRLHRGFDQAERIGRPLAARLGLPYRRLLERRRPTRRQALLDRAARRRNPRSAFRALDSAHLPRRVLLVDDVVTTAATVAEAAAALVRGGAERPRVACLARTLPASVPRSPGRFACT